MIAVENILTQANYFNLSDPTVVLYGRAGQGLEISKRNRSFPPLVQALMASVQSAPVCTSLHQSADLSRHCSTAAGEKFCSYEARAGGAHPSHPGTGLLTGHLQPGAGAGEYIDIF